MQPALPPTSNLLNSLIWAFLIFTRFFIYSVYIATALHASGAVDAVAFIFARLTIRMHCFKFKEAAPPKRLIINFVLIFYGLARRPCGRSYILWILNTLMISLQFLVPNFFFNCQSCCLTVEGDFPNSFAIMSNVSPRRYNFATSFSAGVSLYKLWGLQMIFSSGQMPLRGQRTSSKWRMSLSMSGVSRSCSPKLQRINRSIRENAATSLAADELFLGLYNKLSLAHAPGNLSWIILSTSKQIAVQNLVSRFSSALPCF